MFPDLIPLPVAIADDMPQPTLWRFASVRGPGDGERDVYVALPPGYEPSARRRYPVVYFQDGQNLFDPELAYAEHWGLLETLALSDPRRAPIVVGIPNLGPGRLREYSPFDEAELGEGDGEAYLKFVRQTVKPTIDRVFRTRPARASTAIAGSSMGGLMALYGLMAGAGTFGSAWALSPALWYAHGAVFEWLAHHPAPVGRIWLDAGVGEGAEQIADVRRMRDLMIGRGWKLDDTLRYAEDPEGEHDEMSWGRRLRENWTALTGMLA